MKNGESIEKQNNQNNDNKDSWGELQSIPFDPDRASKLVLSESGDIFGEGRYDKNATVVDPEGNTKKTSSIMVGKKENGPVASPYISIEDARQQVLESLGKTKEGTRIVRMEPPAEMSVDAAITELAKQAKSEGGSFGINDSSVFSNQQAKSFEFQPSSSQETLTRGVFMLGNEEIKFSNGEYVSQSALEQALQNYMFESPKDTPFVVAYTPASEIPTPARPSLANRLKKILPIVGAAILAMTIISATISPNSQAIQGRDMPIENTPVTEHVVDAPIPDPDEPVEVDGYTFSTDSENPTAPDDSSETSPIKTPEDLKAESEAKLNGVNIGDVYEIPDGVAVHESSDYQYDGANATGIVGNEELPDRDYTIQSYSVLDPETHEVIADNVTWQEGTNLGQYLQQISERTGYSVEQLSENTKIHIGHGDSHAGWADYSDIVNKDIIERSQND